MVKWIGMTMVFHLSLQMSILMGVMVDIWRFLQKVWVPLPQPTKWAYQVKILNWKVDFNKWWYVKVTTFGLSFDPLWPPDIKSVFLNRRCMNNNPEAKWQLLKFFVQNLFKTDPNFMYQRLTNQKINNDSFVVSILKVDITNGPLFILIFYSLLTRIEICPTYTATR